MRKHVSNRGYEIIGGQKLGLKDSDNREGKVGDLKEVCFNLILILRTVKGSYGGEQRIEN
jgi:hypothetical protein